MERARTATQAEGTDMAQEQWDQTHDEWGEAFIQNAPQPPASPSQDVDAATGCADDQQWAGVPTEALRGHLSTVPSQEGGMHLTNGRLCEIVEQRHGSYGDLERAMAAELLNRRAVPSQEGGMREALKPFATFGVGVEGEEIRDGLMRDRICDWFGPSDFDAARVALAHDSGKGK